MAAPFGSNNIASTGSAYATEAGYTNFFKVAYSDDVRLKSMQLASGLIDAFDREPMNGSPLTVQLVKKLEEGYGGAVASNDPASSLDQNRNRVAAVTYGAVPTETRTMLPNFWDFHHLFDPRDARALMRDIRPGSSFQRAVISSLIRKVEKEIIRALDGSATVDGSGVAFASEAGKLEIDLLGDVNGTLTTIATGTNTMDVLGLSTAKLAAARGAIEEGDGARPGEPLVAIMSPRQHANLLANDSKVVNYDFTSQRALDSGKVSNWLGMEIIVTNAVEKLELTDGTGVGPFAADPFAISTGNGQLGGGEYAYVCTKDSVLVGTDPVETKIDIIPERGHSVQLAHYGLCGAVRLDASKMCRIQCAVTDA